VRIAAVFAALAVAGCTSFSGGADQPAVNPNIAPANYKAAIMGFLQNDPYALVGVREAALSPPALMPFGTESRYVACVRAQGPDWKKEKMIIFYAGEINQFVDATGDACAKAAYQPFPEIVAVLNQLAGKKK
jgi:hypothetical protein